MRTLERLINNRIGLPLQQLTGSMPLCRLSWQVGGVGNASRFTRREEYSGSISRSATGPVKTPPMAKLQRNLRQRAVVNAFVRAGGRERPGKGSHIVVKMSNGMNLSIPTGVIKIGLLRYFIRTAELTEAEFAEYL